MDGRISVSAYSPNGAGPGRLSVTTQRTGGRHPPAPLTPPANAAPAVEATLEKAVFYDALNDAVASGVDDARAVEMGHHARARAKEIHERMRQRAADERERAALAALSAATAAATAADVFVTVPSIVSTAPPSASAPAYPIFSSALSEAIACAEPQWPTDIHAKAHPYTTPVNHTGSLATLLKKIVSPAVRRGIREGDVLSDL
ncbi:hypothetical protein HDU83_006294 [Entophlyctis luteolus]|nr:hypothetical protein HDU83_006294 [Entophlyctis luteolus]